MYRNLVKLASDESDKGSEDLKNIIKHIGGEALKAGITAKKGQQFRDDTSRTLSYKTYEQAIQRKDRKSNRAKVKQILKNLEQHAGSPPDKTVSDVLGTKAYTYNLPGKKLTFSYDIPSMSDSMREAHNAKRVWQRMGDENKLKLFENAFKDPHKRSMIIHTISHNPSLVLHELGHATGRDRTDTLKHRLIGANYRLHNRFRDYGKNRSAIAAAVSPSLASVTRQRNGESDEDYLDRKQKRRHLANASTALPALPTLIEEGRASINAYKLGKKMGIPVDKKTLGLAFGSYASALVPQALRASTDIAAHKVEKSMLENRRKNS